MKDIYIENDMLLKNVSEFENSLDIINSSTKKMKELLTDLNQYWKASSAKNFTSIMEGYINQCNEYYKKSTEMIDKQKLSLNTYKKFDDYFSNKSI